MLLSEIDDSGWLVPIPRQIKDVVVFRGVNCEELTQAVHELGGAKGSFRVRGTAIIKDCAPLDANDGQLAHIVPHCDGRRVLLVVNSEQKRTQAKCIQ